MKMITIYIKISCDFNQMKARVVITDTLLSSNSPLLLGPDIKNTLSMNLVRAVILLYSNPHLGFYPDFTG